MAGALKERFPFNNFGRKTVTALKFHDLFL